MMTVKQVVAADQLRYRKPIRLVEKLLKDMDIAQETDIRVYPNYPAGWEATVGAHNRVYVFTMTRGRLQVTVEPCLGFYPNGALIRR